MKESRTYLYKRILKRPLDFIFAISALVILSPILLFVVILIRICLGKPIFFKQKRAGLNGEIFTLYKFRTMSDQRDRNDELLPDAVRLTRLGKFLRATSIDELPELINIIKGEMSLIGPRPLLPQYLPLYSERQKRRHEVRPGLTGLAQISGRNTLSWQDRFELDIKYVENITFVNDLKIFIMTISKVIKREGITLLLQLLWSILKGIRWMNDERNKCSNIERW